MMLPIVGFGQKKENGKIYIEHPAINVVDAFTKAMVKADTTAMAKLMSNDFMAFNPVTSTPYSEGMTKASFFGMVMWMHGNLDYYSIETMKGSYPDAFEYAKDPSDNNAVTVDAWDILKGVHKETGVKADMLLHRSFTLTKDNKISRVSQYMNPEFGNELQRGYSERKNGTIYNEHQNINNLRLMMAAVENGEWDKYYSYFDKDATFMDINNVDNKSTHLDAEKIADKAILKMYDLDGIEQTGYPDYLVYEMGNSGVLLSWWNIHLVRKSDKKKIMLPMHYQHEVNKEGKIVHTISYYSSGLLK